MEKIFDAYGERVETVCKDEYIHIRFGFDKVLALDKCGVIKLVHELVDRIGGEKYVNSTEKSLRLLKGED